MSGPRRDSGQATVEFALIVPLLVVLLLAIAQLAAAAYAQLAITHLSREVARALVVDPDADVGSLTTQYDFLEQEGLGLETWVVPPDANGRATIVVRVTYAEVAITPVFGRFLADVTLAAETSMMLES